MLRWLQAVRRNIKRIRITDDFSILNTNDTVGIFFRQFRVVGDHYHQSVLSHLFQQIHDLHTSLRVQCAGRLIRQQNIGIVHQRTGNGHTLHLATGHLIGLLMQLIAQAHILQRLHRPLAALPFGNTGDGQRQFHIGQYSLVRNQIVALEHKTNGMVAVRIPVTVGIFFCGNAIDDQIAAVVPVQATDHIEQGGFAGTAGSQNRHKLVIPQIQAYAIQRGLDKISCDVLLANILDLKH